MWIAALGFLIGAGSIHTALSFWKKLPAMYAVETGQEEQITGVPPLWKGIAAGTEAETSEGYRYEEVFEEVLAEYGQLKGLYCETYSSAVPGLESTDFSYTATDQMVPQGICIAGEFMLITAYDKEKEHNSVIYILSNEDPTEREFLAALILPDQNHVGGITCDGSRVWIAKSTTGYLSVISLERIREAAASGEETVFLGDYDAQLYCGGDGLLRQLPGSAALGGDKQILFHEAGGADGVPDAGGGEPDPAGAPVCDGNPASRPGNFFPAGGRTELFALKYFIRTVPGLCPVCV